MNGSRHLRYRNSHWSAPKKNSGEFCVIRLHENGQIPDDVG